MKRFRALDALLVLLLCAGIGLGAQATWEVYTGATAPGSTTIPAVKNYNEAVNSMNSGATAPSYLVQGTWWYDTTNDLVKWYEGSAWVTLFRVNEAGNVAAHIQGEVAFTADDATPSVKGITSAKTANANPTTITGFDDGTAGQLLTLRIADANTTIGSGLTRTGMAIPGVAGDTLTWLSDGSGWKQTAGNIGMGVYVPLAQAAVTDVPAANITAFQDCDFSKNGVRKGAIAVGVFYQFYKSASQAGLMHWRPDGASTVKGSGTLMTQNGPSAIGLTGHFVGKLGPNAIAEVCFDTDWSASTIDYLGVDGFWI